MADQPSSGEATINLRQQPPTEESERSLKRLSIDVRRRWRQGQRVSVESLLVEHPALVDDPEAVFQLLLVEMLAREEAGDNPVIDEYHLRFPSHGQRLEQEISHRRALRQQETARPSQLLAEVTPLPATEADAEQPPETPDGLPDLVAGYE